MHFTSLASLAALASVSESLPTRDVKGGDITLNAFQLYPENGDVDPETGRAYFRYVHGTIPSTSSFIANMPCVKASYTMLPSPYTTQPPTPSPPPSSSLL